MKKAIFSLIIATAFALGMSACCNNNTPAEGEEGAACTEQAECQKKCELPECTCADAECVCKSQCEMCPDSTCARCAAVADCKAQKEACSEMPECCKEQKDCCKKGDKACCKEGKPECQKKCEKEK